MPSELCCSISSGEVLDGNWRGAFLRTGLGRGESDATLIGASFSSMLPTSVAELVAVLSDDGEAGSAFSVSLDCECGTLSFSSPM